MFSSQLVRMRGRGGRADISRVAVCGRAVAVSPRLRLNVPQTARTGTRKWRGRGGGGGVMDGQWRGLLQTLAQLRGQETRVSGS